MTDRLKAPFPAFGGKSQVAHLVWSTLTRLGPTGVFLDPPYRHTKLGCGTENRTKHIYANDRQQDVDALVESVQAWCLKWAPDPLIRIAACGLEGEYPELDRAGWDKVAWKSRGGYGNRSGKGKANRALERIWFSPSCARPDAGVTLFATEAP